MSAPSAEETLRARAADLAACLREIAAEIAAAPRTSESFVVTGIGASEGPARAMAAHLRATWAVRATFVPLSTFAVGEPRAHGDTLIVFSQSLSPNACFALGRAADFERAILFTSTRASTASESVRDALEEFRAHGRIVTLPEQEGRAANAIANEHGTLVRVLGPCAATLTSALYAGAAQADDVPALLDAIETAPTRVRAATTHVDDALLEGRVALVTAGAYGELCSGIASLWLEALYAPRPPVWDVLCFAHGTFQEIYDSKVLLVALERPGAEAALYDRLAQMLAPERHTLVRLRSSLAAPLAPLDHFAQVHELVCRALRARPRDLRAWPGAGKDAPLYDLGQKL